MYRLDIPFKLAFKHSSAERVRTQSVWVEVMADGVTGRGEGCPREYVTHETLSSAGAFFAEYRESLLEEIRGLDELVSWPKRHASKIDANPAAWCAIELAFLEILAKQQGVSVERLVSATSLTGSFRYTAVIGDSDIDAFRVMATRYRDSGFVDFKLKLSGDIACDQEKIRVLRQLGIDGLRVRVDANNLWERVEDAAEHLETLDCPLLGVEEPLRANDLDGLRRLAERTGSRMILDESLLREDQVLLFEEDPDRWILNLRVSKMGGLTRSLAIVERAREVGVPVIVGAQVGETSVLTRAALTVACAAGDNLLAQEGAFGTRLLETDVVDPSLMFGPGGVVDADELDLATLPGWGLPFTEYRGLLRPIP